MAKDYVGRSKPKKRTAKPSRAVSNKKRFPLPLALGVVAAIVGFSVLLFNIKGTAPTPAPELSEIVKPQATKTKPKTRLPEPPKERTYVKELEEKKVEVELAEKSAEPAKPYQMQCASFRSRDKAEESKALIAFAGLESQIRRTEGKNGAWYRVVLGPFPTKRDAERARHVLQRAKINGCQIWHWNF
ncbi:cell division protein FtsN [Agarivorans sp. Toyoura001]|uniref:SPOR domain-containing protein n=1 Tax=Agarivorans sp. Toyoura001 TaxID=2283141 RepID=UPI0010D2EC21|nr:SPOR domain-containing protein [Agarivorans sp. Toyoura001]GDY27663.1 cell division protein FtsN [Agarivorans sp. Toyoura001]